jgi:hypothetical protein
MLADIMERANVRMAQTGRGAGFPEKAFLRGTGESVQRQLKCD